MGSKFAETGYALKDAERILDFGCGSGRVLRHLRALAPNAELFGCDLHEEAIDWNKETLKFAKFERGSEYPPLPHPDDFFDRMYAISVLTHLDESHQDCWLNEWNRVLKPGGVAIVTYKADDFVESVIKQRDPKFGKIVSDALASSSGILFSATDAWKGILPDYVRRRWAEYFEIVELVPSRGLNGIHQNAAVLRKCH